MLNACEGIAREKKTILQVADYHYERFAEKVKGEKRSGDTLQKRKTTRDKIAAFIDRFYLDYGPMLEEIKGREWCLHPNAVSWQPVNYFLTQTIR